MCRIENESNSQLNRPVGKTHNANNLFDIESYNVRGMRGFKKRCDFMKWLNDRSKNVDLTILVDTHCHLPREARQWRKLWSHDKDDSYWSYGTKNRKGVAILLNPNLKEKAKILKVDIDSNGRYIKLILEIGNLKYRILGVYAPNDDADRINFIRNLNIVLIDEYDAETIVGGDHNLAFSDELDRINCISNHNDKGRVDMLYLIQKHDLEDIFRRRNPDKKQYTYYKNDKTTGQASRIDYWLTSVSLNNQIEITDSHYNPHSDHHGIKLVFRTNETKVGKGLYKINVSHILTTEFRQQFEEMWGEWRMSKPQYNDITKWWDIGKRKIKNLAKDFSFEKSLNRKVEIEELESEITCLQNSKTDSERLLNLKKKHADLLEEKTEGARIRSRLQFWEEGERSTKYFHNLERRNGKNKSWDSILDDKKNIIKGTNAIQQRQVEFYKDLFTSQNLNSDTNFFLGNAPKQLTEDSKKSLEEEITLPELFKSLKLMPNNKSPGEDGIPIELYKTYFNIMGQDMLDVFRVGLDNRELSYSQYLAVITLLYKKGTREDIRNWRPISLLNTDYKVLSKVLAERLKKVLPEIINSDQRGGVKGRLIGENIRLIEDVLFEIENLEDDAIIFLQDQEKAFDRVEFNWLFSSLKHFNFGDKYISWLKTLYKNSKSSVMTNGVQSSYFSVTRGIRQGDSLSALLYIIQLEPLAEKIRQANDIKGITIKLKNMNNEEVEIKCCQYVDDSNTFLKNKNYIDRLLYILKQYEIVSGSKINLDKTVALAIKSKREETISNINLKQGPEKVLGVPIGGTDLNNNKAMWQSLTSKLRDKLGIWINRDLSLQGKTHIIRSIGISKVLYTLEMKTIDEKSLKELDDVIWRFLWSGKDVRFNRDICQMPRRLGGLGLIDIRIIIKVRRIIWVLRALKEKDGQNWAKLIENYIRCLDNKFGIQFFSMKVTDASDLIDKANIPQFYKECLKYFQELIRIAKVNTSNEIIWCNHKHTFNGKPLSFGHWSKSGITKSNQLYAENSLDQESLFNRLRYKAGFIFEFQTIKSVFPSTQIEEEHDGRDIENEGKQEILEYQIQLPGGLQKSIKDLTSKEIYNIFLYNKNPSNLSKTYWEQTAFPGYHFNWEAWFHYNLENKLTPRKCKDMAFKIFYSLLSTESRLKRMGFSNGICSVCSDNSEPENVSHLIWSCSYKRKLWKMIENLIKSSLLHSFTLTRLEAICGYFVFELDNDSVSIINMLLSLVRYHIWLSRNAARFDNKNISFIESYLRLRYTITDHIQLLLQSKTTKKDIKDKLSLLLTEVPVIFRDGIREDDI